MTRRTMVPLTPKRSPYGPHNTRRRHNRPHVAEKASMFLFLSVPHRPHPDKDNGLGAPLPKTSLALSRQCRGPSHMKLLAS
jgi:hypothetical protein